MMFSVPDRLPIAESADTVCILNKGRLVAQGPIEQIMSDSEETAYSVTIDGDADGARERLLKEAWVSGVSISDGGASLTVSVTDADQAELKLQRLLLRDKNLIVREFTQKSASLEEAFVDLVEGDADDLD